MAINAGDVLRLAVVFKDSNAGTNVNVLHVSVTGAGSGGDAGCLADIQDYIDDLYSNVKTWIHSSVTGLRIEVTNVTDGTTHGSIQFSPAWTGSAATLALPAANSMLIVHRTLLPRVQGRTYLPKMDTTAFGGNDWTATAITAGNAFASKFLTPFTAAGNGWDFLGIVWRSALGVHEPILSGQAMLEPAYQRRRKEGRGS